MAIEVVDDVLDIVGRIEDDRSSWVTVADQMEEMWSLRGLWDSESDETRTYVTSSSPYNAVETARRMLNTVDIQVECPAMYSTQQSDLNQDMKERWLKAMWRQARIERKENIIGSAYWQGLVLGQGVFQILWVKDSLPAGRRDRQMPFVIRTLDPRMCGFEEGPLYTQYAFYKPEMSVLSIRQQFPDYQGEADGEEDEEKEVIDFWWVSPDDGKVWNCVVVDNEFVMEPMATKYIDIPLVRFSGGYQPSSEEDMRHTSFLYPLRNSWEVTSDVLTMTATALMYHYFPVTRIVNEFGESVNDEPEVPGEVRQYPAGTQFPNVFNSPNQALANNLLQYMMEETRESTFTGAANGMPLGSNQAGYSYSAAMQADESRIQQARENLQIAVATVNEIALGFVDAFGGSQGVVMQGRAAELGGRYIVRLTSDMVDGEYRNEVYLKPTTARDEASMVALGQRLVDGRTISRQTMRDLFIDKELPANEEQLIQLEAAMQNPATAPIVALHTLMSYVEGGEASPAMQQLIQMYQAQADAIMAQLQQQQMGAPQPGPAPAPQAAGVQPPSMSGGMLAPVAEGQVTEGTVAQGNGERISPDLLREIIGGGGGAPPIP